MSHSEKGMLYSEKTEPPPYEHGGSSRSVGQFERAGQFEGGSYTVNHRNASSTVTISLQENGRFVSRIESVIHMSKGIGLEPAEKFSLRPRLRDSWTKYMTFSGPGNVTLGPDILGDILALPVDSTAEKGQWSVRTELTLAVTEGVHGTLVKKEFSTGTFEAQEFNHYTLYGKGIFVARTYGVIDRIELGVDQVHIVETSHLVAWINCALSPVKLTGKRPSFLEVQGPGTVYVQARVVEDFIGLAHWAGTH